MGSILTAAALVSGIGLFFGIILSAAALLFKTEENETEKRLREALPGANCGACSFAGCAEYAKALATGRVKTTLCPVGGEKVVKQISEILGVKEAPMKKKVAFVQCQGSFAHAKKEKRYVGVETCFAARLLCRGEGACAFGCDGYGDCAAACPYDAIAVTDGVARVDPAKCTGCSLCVAACPKNIISMVYAGDYAKVACKNTEKGARTRKACDTGCIGCGKCVRACPENAITLIDNRAVVDLDKCVGCGACVEVCPTNSIVI